MSKTRGRRIGRDRQDGAVAVEFALIAPILILILAGVVQFGIVYSQYQVLQGAAREGARCAAVQAAGYSSCSVSGSMFGKKCFPMTTTWRASYWSMASWSGWHFNSSSPQ